MSSHVSYSQISAANTCEYRFWLHYAKRIRSPYRYRAPELGSAVHVGIAAVLSDTDAGAAISIHLGKALEDLQSWVSLAPDAVEEGEVMLQEISDLAPKIVDFWSTNWSWDRWEPIHVEKPFRVQVDGVDVLFVPDLIARDRMDDDNVWVWDWKVRKQFQSVEAEEINLQKAMYQWLLQRAGIETVGSAILQIYPGVPAAPTLLKAGDKLSRARIRTDWPTYAAEVERHGFDLSDYDDMRFKIETGWDAEWFRTSQAYRPPALLDSIWESVVEPRLSRNEEILSGETKPIRRLGSMNCQGCWARTICLGEINGVSIDEWVDLGAYVKQEEKHE